MTLAVEQKAIVDWATKYTGLEFILANQNASRPEYPFGVIGIASDVPQGTDDVRIDPDTGELMIAGQRLITVSVQVHALSQHPSENSRALVRGLRTSFKLPSVVEAFRAAGLSTIRTLGLQVLDRQIEGRWESICSMDVQFGGVDTLREPVSFVESIEIDNEIVSPPNTIEV